MSQTFAKPLLQCKNIIVLIDLRNQTRQRLFCVEVDALDPPSVVKSPKGGGEVYLNWDQAMDDQCHLRRCPVCGCRELFVRKDFHQVTGLGLVVLAAVVTMVLFGFKLVLAGFIVLGVIALIDAGIYLFTGKCLVCYRCRSEFRRLPIRRDHPRWNLSIGEKYRVVSPDVLADKPSPQIGVNQARENS